MALSKEIDTPFGVKASYVRLSSMQVYFAERCVDVVLSGYLDEAARRGGAQPLTAHHHRLSLDDVGDDPARASIYPALKALPDWDGATDV